MKISKLFHWLYALVMLLPIFAIGGTMLISTFNMNAKNEVVTQYKYRTNNYEDDHNLIQGNIYSLDVSNLNITESGDYYFFSSTFLKFNNVQLFTSDFGTESDNILFVMYYRQNSDNLIVYYSLNGQYQRIIYTSVVTNTITNIDFVYYASMGNFNKVENLITHSDYNEITGYSTEILDAQSVFYKSVDKVTQSNLFNWAYDSFLVAPFTYIVSLFSMPGNSPVVMLLSYWLAISIIWLVFDLVMYVPLLVHRWLDKGVIE